ncbi:ion channel domain-containing protein [Ditylenchus destructor]|uniref:Ion channel domain-containing protein n=1 Tax=Ditylenchus destructor TaxID=166010 RepID=A0AAD4MV42_9BILA|nr:ion channel domain-containing protein [Ditylenchus destructor]
MQLNKRTKRAVLLLSATLLYLTFGALVFGYFEYEYDLQLREEIREARLAMHRKYNFDGKDFALLEQVVVKSIPFAAGLQWKFLGAVYFAVTVVTTVGYGHSAPATAPGKLFCMIFALVGIPLGLVTFQSVGERINHIIRSCLMRTLSQRGSPILQNVKSRHLLFVSSTIGVLTITIGTIVFHRIEHWSLFDSYYYCVITLSTIGFGDFVPLQTRGRLQNDVGYWAFTIIFILFGLAIFSACVNLLILEFMARNADMITAGTRLRKGILSLKRSASFKALSFRDSAFTTPRRIPKNLKRSNSVDTKTLNGKHETCLPCNITTKNDKHPGDHSCPKKKKHKRERVYFAVRRLPTDNIMHLVNTDRFHIWFQSTAQKEVTTPTSAITALSRDASKESVTSNKGHLDIKTAIVKSERANGSPECRSNNLTECLSSIPYFIARLPLYTWLLFVRIFKIMNVLRKMCITGYDMLWFAYNYPTASRHATWLAYRALMASYQMELWSLTGLYTLYMSKDDDE